MRVGAAPTTVAHPAGRQSKAAQEVARGTARMLAALGFATLTELTLASGRRADLVALGPSGDVWIVEIKSSPEDFRADRKWPEYRACCDRLFFATTSEVPAAIFPEATGLIIADAFGAMIVREAPVHPLAASARRSVTLRFAHRAATRLHALCDPAGASVNAEDQW
jgi:hypothetical protein